MSESAENPEVRKEDADEFNESQLSVLNFSENMSVVAGAGTGKTKTLVEYILRFLEKDMENRSVTDVLALTFSEKAAGEMRERLLAGLRTRLRGAGDHGDNVFWSREIRRLGNSEIGTIHGYAFSFLTKSAWTLGLPLGLDVDSPEEEEADFPEVLAEMTGNENPDLSGLLRFMPFRSGHNSVSEILKKMTERMSAWGLMEIVPKKAPPLALPLELTRELRESLAGFIEQFRHNNYDREKLIKPADIFLDDVDAFLNNHPDSSSVTGLSLNAFLTKFLHFKKLRSITHGQKDLVKSLKETLKRGFHSLIQYFDGETRTTEYAKVRLGNISKLLPKLLLERRLGRGKINFDDFLFLARKILLERPEIRGEEHDRRKLIVIDEFQDTNRLQADLLGLIVREPDEAPLPFSLIDFKTGPQTLRVFGDPKQSIYGFRASEPSIMCDLSEKLGGPEGGERNLDTNYRTGGRLVEFFNAFFSGYLGDQGFKPQKHHKDLCYEGPPVRVLTLDKDSAEKADTATRKTLEARILVRYLDELFDGTAGVLIPDEETKVPRLPTPGDVAILLRRKSYADVYEAALKAGGYPCHTVKGTRTFQEPAVRGLAATYLYLAGLEEDLNLATLLLSPAGPVPADVLDKLVLSDEDGFPPRLKDYFSAPSREFPEDIPSEHLLTLKRVRELLGAMRPLAGKIHPGRLMEFVAEERGLIPMVFEEDKPSFDRVKNIQNFLGLVKDFPLKNKRTPLSPGEYLRNLRDGGHSTGDSEDEEGAGGFGGGREDSSDDGGDESDLDDTAAKAVKIMTVHKSKGLEFPVVIVAEADFKPQNRTGSVLIDDDGEFSVKFTPEGWPGSYDTEDFSDIAEKHKAAELAEYKRLFYVAATRAREHLVLSGHFHEKTKADGDPYDKSWLAAVKASGLANEDAISVYSRKDTEKEDFVRGAKIPEFPRVSGEPKPDFYPRKEMLSPLPEPEESYSTVTGYARDFASREKDEIPAPAADEVKTVTDDELSDTDAFDFVEREKELKNASPEPRTRRGGGMDPRDKGILFHAVMESTDFSKSLDEYLELFGEISKGLNYNPSEAEISRLARRALDFQEGEFGRDIREAMKDGGIVWKEWPLWIKLKKDKFGRGPVTLVGVVDLFYAKDNVVGHVLDYKLNKPKNEGPYRKQIQLYADAIGSAGKFKEVKTDLWYVNE
ncbi:MAG: UvrD-helicase domain-containing protein [Deltaproteobacteria bacterium]|nr:UvrD-helicase domain-containing protein [Deltaproteobacteria bacterium]